MTPNPTLKIEKRINDELDGIRKVAMTLPPKQRNALINKCGKISGLGRKAQAIADARASRPIHAGYDARTHEDIDAQMKAKKAVFDAMLHGAKVDLTMSERFQLSQMHTAIHQIRRDIDRRHPNLELCDEWVRKEGHRPYKRYWITRKPGGGAEI